MILTSTSFVHTQALPAKYTCDGDDAIPQLQWDDAPPGTQSFVLVVADPDAPGGTFIHWLVQDIPPTVSDIPEGGAAPGTEVENSFGRRAWGGPCPPSGEHRYFFKLFALDTPTVEGLTLENYAAVLAPHVLATAELLGVYRRP